MEIETMSPNPNELVLRIIDDKPVKLLGAVACLLQWIKFQCEDSKVSVDDLVRQAFKSAKTTNVEKM